MSFLLYSIGSFLAGLVSFMAPCTLPLIPAYFAYSGTSERSKVVSNTLFFGIGMALTFILLGVLAGSLGRIVLTYKKEVILISAILIIIFGLLSLLGKSFKIFNFNINYTDKTIKGSLIFGSLMGLIWSGCLGPVLGAILILAANTGTAFGGGLLLFIHSLGLLLPLFLFSLFLYKLPKDGKFWRFMKGRLLEFNFLGKKRYIHTTNLLTGILFILLGVIILLDLYFGFTKLILPSTTNLVFDIQDWIINTFKISSLRGFN
ncbi:cytochrome c biogenesis protein CcdA [Candidatus Woesearchaeota archaeon]|nr:cytochrome c biogenesis protein CcdA [Candidatus Woesearchaeota archaeon]